jgi:hypothetical protein
MALSANGDTAFIAASGDNHAQGAVFVFTRINGRWAQEAGKLTFRGQTGAPDFGDDVALSADGTTALIGGARDHDFRGAAWVFVRHGSTWKQQGPKLRPRDVSGHATDFGAAVSLSANGKTALIGGLGDNHKQGAAWIFHAG